MVALSINQGIYTHRKDRFVDVETEKKQPAARRSSRRRGLHAKFSTARWDSMIFAAAGVLVALFLTCSVLSAIWRSSEQPSVVALALEQPIVTITVKPGDTLWRYASTYGNPNQYILERIDTIARDNHVTSNTPLIPGQHLRIAVTNPVEAAKLQSKLSRVASL